MKQIKSFRISEENIKLLESDSKERDRTQSWIVNQAIGRYFKNQRYLNEKVLKSVKK